jgi:hypothetical protein
MYKIRIKRLPMAAMGMEMGDEMGNALPVGSPFGGRKLSAGGKQRQDVDSVRSFLPEVDRSMANVEAEKGERVMGNFNGDGIPEFFNIGGRRHSEGGTPLRVPEGSFVFSDTKRMRIGGPILQLFGKSGSDKKKYTPAQLAKPFQMNQPQAVLQDPDADRLDKETAALMLQNSQDKLAKLALLQEAMKGFPQGIPSIAAPLVQQPFSEMPQTPQMPSTAPVMAQDGVWLRPNAAVAMNDIAQLQQNPNYLFDWFRAQRNRPVASVPSYPWSLSAGNPAGMIGDQGVYNPAVVGPVVVASPPNTNPKLIPKGTASARAGTANRVSSGLPVSVAIAGLPTTKSPGTPSTTRSLYGNDVFASGDANTKVLLPSYLQDNTKAEVAEVQQKRSNGMYGSQDWDMDDFYKRHSWVKELRPGFDYNNEDDVRWFQNEYNKRYEKIWANKYFNGQGHRKVDGKFGQGTFSTPAVSTTSAAKEKDIKSSTVIKKADHPEDVKKNEVEPGDFEPILGEEDIKMSWTPQDKLNAFAALRNRGGLKRISPEFVGVNLKAPDYVLPDYMRNVVANQEAANAQGMMAGLFAGPQRNRAVNNSIWSQSMKDTANVFGQWQPNAASIVNQSENVAAEVANKEQMMNAAAKKTYKDEQTVLEDQYANSLAAADENVRANILNGMTNAQRFYWMNKLNEQYQIDPSTGRLFFKKGKNLLAKSGSGSGNDPFAVYKAYHRQYLKEISNDPDAAKEFALKAAFPARGGAMSPDMMGMLQQYSGG